MPYLVEGATVQSSIHHIDYFNLFRRATQRRGGCQPMKFEYYQDTKKAWHWRLLDGSRIVALGENYPSKAECQSSMKGMAGSLVIPSAQVDIPKQPWGGKACAEGAPPGMGVPTKKPARQKSLSAPEPVTSTKKAGQGPNALKGSKAARGAQRPKDTVTSAAEKNTSKKPSPATSKAPAKTSRR